MKSNTIRQAFLDYFRRHDHQIVPSSSLVPAQDPTLLFTNAGMVPFKDVFLGREQRSYSRAASVQRCVRAGGKHNDLENVGYTARHHTFFEMLGNFSFGDYFKREAIRFAWEFLTQEMGIPPARLWVTVFEEDDEAAQIWLQEMNIDPQRFGRIGAQDNFWSMGDTGPCGPCSEIFYDHGPGIPGGPPGSPDAEGDRYVEIWNLVFMQYDRKADGSLVPLPKPSVDTGMGLERLAAVMQGVHSNYEIDLFRHLIAAAARETGCEDLSENSLKVIADHIRSTSFLITDGVVPSNEGRGYVLRRIIRRAVRHGYKLGQQGLFFHRLVGPLVEEMGEAYPELRKAQQRVEQVLKWEEERFAETLEQGLKILDRDLATLSGNQIPGETIFKLYDTYGFPVDLTGDIAREKGLTLDMAGFEEAMSAQRERARSTGRFVVDYSEALRLEQRSVFTGYGTTRDEGTVVALIRDGRLVEQLHAGESGAVVLDRTPFYAEAGGQVGDTGVLQHDSAEFTVRDTQKAVGEAIIHQGRLVRGTLVLGARVQARVDEARRQAIRLNHSATHLLHAALRRVLGSHVTQKGSLVEPERLRFDFSHFQPVTRDELQRIEYLVNEQIRRNAAVETQVTGYEQAVASGALALFGEKYGDQVRVLRMGDFSTELCGGTHVSRCGDIGLFKIIAEGGIAAGVRRIEALTGERALQWVSEQEARLERIAANLNTHRDDIEGKVTALSARHRQLEKELEQLKSKLAFSQGADLAAQAVDVNGHNVLAAVLDTGDAKVLRETVDQLKNKLGSAAIILASVAEGDKVRLVAGVTKDLVPRVKAGELVNYVAQQLGGRGGGRPDLAQAGAPSSKGLDTALGAVPDWVKSRI